MKIASRHYFWIIPLLCILSAPVWWSPFTAFLTPRTDGAGDAGQALQAMGKNFSLDHIVFNLANKGRQQWQVKARQLYTAGSEEDLRLEEVDAHFFGDEGRQSARITGEQGRYRSDLQELTVNDNVVIATERGYTARTQTLRYLEKNNQLIGENGVTVESGRFRVSGERLRYDITTGKVVVEGRVVCRINQQG